MDHFSYRNGELFAENVNVARIAEQVGTPVYIYSKATFIDHVKRIQSAFSNLDSLICFSVKACGNINILKLLKETGCGFDVVSGGELYRAQQAGADPSKIVFAGVGKTDTEIIDALNSGIGYFNIESEAELENIIALANKLGKKTKAALRINPDVDAETHSFTTTGTKETKFGVDIDRARSVFDTYGRNSAVQMTALHIHLGSAGKTIEPYAEALDKTLVLIDDLRKQGYSIDTLDLGGGYGAEYEKGYAPTAADYAEVIVPKLIDKNLKLIIEPGASVAANAGILVTKVVYLKQGGEKKFVIVDAGMNDLIRPPLYGAFHFIWPTKVDKRFETSQRQKDLNMEGCEPVDVVGPICEGTDFFAKVRPLPPVQRNDLISIYTAGAYGYTMSSNYNARPMVPEVLVDNDRFAVIRRRQTYEDLVALER